MPPFLALLLAALPQAPAAPVASYRGYPEADALRYALHLRLDPRERRLEGWVEARFRALEELRVLKLDSVAGEGWERSFEDLEGRPLSFTQDGDRVLLDPGRTLAAGEVFAFRVRLEGRPPDGLYFFDTRYGEPCAFTDHFSVRARGWLPCEDDPSDRARFALELEIPEGFDAVCSGRGRRLEAGEAWPEDSPVPPAARRPVAEGWFGWVSRPEEPLPTYLLALAVAPFARVEEGGDPRLVPHRIYRKDLPRARRGLVHHAEWLALLEETFGPYPYQKYCVVQVPTRWGGMENAGNTFVMENLFESPRFGASILAHELAHQWFGDGVGYRSWKEVWLSEGFASYFGPWLDAATGGPPLARSLEQMRRSWASAPEAFRLPVRWDGYEKPDQVLNRNTYPKGAWILHMLRGEIGDEAFFGGLRSWFLANRGRSVDTDSLREALEEASGRELGWFFEQWLDRPGCPVLRLEAGDERVLLHQEQEGEPYRFRLRLRWTGAGGQAFDRVFEVDEAEEVLELEDPPVRSLQVDPEVELLWIRAR